MRRAGWPRWSVKGSTAVSPFEKGSGCTTFGASVMRTVSVPWLMATREIFTSLPMTMVPVRSSTTTRAGASDLDDQVLEFGIEARRRDVGRLADHDGARILLGGDALAEALHRVFVDHVGDAHGGREVGVAQLQRQRADVGEARLDLRARRCRHWARGRRSARPASAVSASPWAVKPETKTGPCATA